MLGSPIVSVMRYLQTFLVLYGNQLKFNVLRILFLIGLSCSNHIGLTADYYWVGGTGDWSDISHWATTSGGTTFHFIVPTPNDDVHFDDNSFTASGQAVTITDDNSDNAVVCRDIDWTGALYNPTLAGDATQILRIYGSLTLVDNMNWTFAGPVYFEATTIGHTITTAGNGFNNNISFQGLGGGWMLTDSLSTSSNIIFTSGNLVSNGHSISCKRFLSTNSESRTLNIQNTSIYLYYTGWEDYAWDINGDNFALYASNSIIIFLSNGQHFRHYSSPVIYNNVFLFGNHFNWNRFYGGNSEFNLIIIGDTSSINTSNGYGFNFYNNNTIDSIICYPQQLILNNGDSINFLQSHTHTYIQGTHVIQKGIFHHTSSINGNNSIDSAWMYKSSSISENNTIVFDSIFENASINGSTSPGNTFNHLVIQGNSSFSGTNQAQYCKLNGNSTLSDDNTFDSLYFRPGKMYQFGSGDTLKIEELLSVTGSCTGSIILNATISGSQAYIRKTLGNITGNYLSLRDMNGMGGATFTADNSVDLGNNTGWNITTADTLDLYWVGGSGNWDDPAHWDTVSGGPGGSCLATAIDNVFFDANSFTTSGQTVTINVGNAVCHNMSWAGALHSPTLDGISTNIVRIYGSLSLINDMSWDFQGPVYFEATTTGHTVTTAGNGFNNNISFQGLGGGWMLTDSLSTSSNIIFTSGNLVSNGHSISCKRFLSTNSESRTLNIQNTSIYLYYTGWEDYAWDINGDNFALYASNSIIIFLSNGQHFRHYSSPVIYNNVFLFGNHFNWNRFYGGNSEFNLIIIGDTSSINTSNGYGFNFYNNNTIDSIICYPQQLILNNGDSINFLQSHTHTYIQGTHVIQKGIFHHTSSINGNNSIDSAWMYKSSSISENNTIVFDSIFENASINGSTSPGNTFNHLVIQGNSSFSGTNQAQYCKLNGNSTLSDDNTFDSLYLRPGKMYEIGANDTIFVNDTLGVRGNNCFPIIIRSQTNTIQAHISKPDGIVSGDFLELRDMDATGGATFYAGSYSTDLSNNTGWIFTNSPGYIYGLGNDTSMCIGDTLQTWNFNGAYAYLWQNGSTLPYFTVYTPGTYWVTATYAINCQFTDTIVVDTMPTPVATVTGGDQYICYGDTLLLNGTVTQGITPYTYQWIPVTGLSDPAIQDPLAYPELSTTYVFRAIGANGCDGHDTILIEVNPEISATFTVSNPTTCGGTDGIATVNPSGGTPLTTSPYYTYSWNTIPIQTSQTATGLSAGLYIVTVTDAESCSVEFSTTLSDPTSPAVTLLLSDTVICSGQSVTFTASGADFYQFFINGDSIGQTSSVNTFDTIISTAGNFLISVEGTTAGCTASTPGRLLVVQQSFPVSVTISASANPVTTGTEVTFTASPVNGGTNPGYQWFVNGGQAGSNSPTYTFTPSDDDTVFCVLTSNLTCPVNDPDTSNIIIMQVDSWTPCPGIPTVLYEGKTYNTVQIGLQCWLKENLDVGVMIYGDSTQTDNDTIEKYCYNNEPDSCTIYGGFYQWDEMMQYVTNEGVQGICPDGWRIPTDAEWCIMSTYLDSTINCTIVGWSGNDCGGRLKESGTLHWVTPNTGATNVSGFTALGGGYRGGSGTFYDLNIHTNFWSSTDNASPLVKARNLRYDRADLGRSVAVKSDGFAVRCMRDTCSTITTAFAGPDQISIIGTTTTLDGNTPSAWETGSWSIASGTGGNIIDPSSPTSTFSGTEGTWYDLVWTITNSCNQISRDTVTISFNLPCPGLPTVVYAGKTYNTVQIGTQCWLKENLDVGVMIPGTLDQVDNDTIEKYCYNNDLDNCAVYGGLYQWDEMMHYVITEGVQGICPNGWHIPSDAEWCTLENEIDAGTISCSSTGFRGIDAGGNLKETDTIHWQSPNIGATNSSGFTALPGGVRTHLSYFDNFAHSAYFWTSTEAPPYAYFRFLYKEFSTIYRNHFDYITGVSVRCLKDTCSTITTATAGPDQISIPGNSTTLEGNAPLVWETGTWSIASGTGGSITDPYNPTSTFTGVSGNLYELVWTIMNSCNQSSDDTVVISFDPYTTCPGIPTVVYGGKTYNTIQIDCQCWLRENLDIGTMISGSQSQSNNSIIEKYCYGDNSTNCDIYGGLYQWNESMQYTTDEGTQGICPTGWHLPTDDEWKVLEGAVDSIFGVCDTIWDLIGYRGSDAGKRLKSTTGWYNNGNGTNTSGFTALPGGYNIGGYFDLITLVGYYWSSTELNTEKGWERILFWDHDDSWRGNFNKQWARSVRCIYGEVNHPPDDPANPDPSQGATNQSLDLTLSWTCSDPDNDTLTYDILFGQAGNISTLATAVSDSFYFISNLQPCSEYFWQILAHDDHCACTTGPLWSFSTIGLDTLEVTITASNDTVCQGDTVCFTATIINGGANPSFEWFVNGTSVYSSNRVISGLIASYPFNGNSFDVSGNGNHGTVNEAILTTDRYNRSDKAYYFDGINDYITIPTSTHPLGNVDLSYSAWIHAPTYNHSGQAKAIIDVGFPGIQNDRSAMHIYPQGNHFGKYCAEGNDFVFTNDSVPTNAWYHLIMTKDSTNQVSEYINGLFIQAGTVSPGQNLTGSRISIAYNGEITWNTGEFFKGTLDDIKIYNRPLSEYEVTQLYNESCSTFCYVPQPGDTVYCIATSSDTCIINNPDTSNLIIMTVIQPDTLEVMIFESSNPVCVGDTVCFSAFIENGGSNPTYQWNVNGDIQEGLVAWYPFSGDAFDASGNGNHGNVNGATLTTDRYGRANSAYSFDGIDDFIIIPNSNSLNFTDQITLAYWVKLESSAPYYFPYHIIEKYDSWGSGQREWDINFGIGLSFSNWLTSFTADVYYFLVMTYDGDSIRVYKNGEKCLSSPLSGSIPYNTNDVYFGEYTLGGDYYFDGVLDDIRIYNRALSEREVYILYHEGDTSFCYVPANGDTISLIVTSDLPCITNNPDTSNLIIITVNQPDTLEVTITASANPVCAGDTVCFTATIENGGNNPTYQWNVNGSLSEGLLAWYPFNGNANDETGNGHDGTVTGASTTTDRFGNPDKACLFNGTSDKIDAAFPDLPLGDQSRTISLWAKGADNIPTQDMVGYGSDNPFHSQFYINYWENNCPAPTFTNGIGIDVHLKFFGTNIHFTDQWKHIVVSYDQNSKKIRVYINGSKIVEDTVTLNTTLDSNDSTLHIGSEDGLFRYFDGKIDDIRIYNRMLSDIEVTSLYHEGDTTFCYVPSDGDTVYLVVTSDQPCVTNNPDTSNMIIMIVDSVPTLALSDTNSACSIPIILDAGSGASTYLWSSTETSQSISVDETGWYWCTATNGSCSTSDTIFVDLIRPEIVPDDTLLCSPDTLQLTLLLEGGPNTCSLQYLFPSLQQGLVAYYPFCGDASDESGNGHHGILVGPQLVHDRFITDSSAYIFPGINEYINLPSSISINENFSIGFWINTTASCPFTFAGYMFIIDRDLCGPMPDWSIGLGNGGKIIFNTGVVGSENILSSVSDINDGEWHHILVVKDGDQNQKRIYIDGFLDAFAAFTGSFTNLSEPIYIGASVCGTPTHIFFDGLLDDVMFHNRALTPSEIASLQISRAILWSTGETNSFISVAPQQDTTYWVTVWDSVLSCTDTITILFDPVSASISGDTLLCEGDTTVLYAMGGSTYLWNTGATTNTLQVYQTGTYWVVATGDHGCTDTAWANVTVNSTPVVSLNLCITKTSRDAKPYPLRGGLPQGGTYSGPGVQGGIMYPSMVPAGQNTINIQYLYNNAFDCQDSVIQPLEVFPASNHTCGNLFTDVRDNRTYSTILFGSTCWMVQNLNYGAHITASNYQQDNCQPEKYCYQEATANCTDFGGLYQWDELMQYSEADSIQGLCPPGWHIPTETDWQALITLFQDPAHAGTFLKSTGTSGFNGLVKGFLVNPAVYKYGANDTTLNSSLFWTSTISSPGKVWAHGLNTVIAEPTFTTSVSSYAASTANAFSVRCVRDW